LKPFLKWLLAFLLLPLVLAQGLVLADLAAHWLPREGWLAGWFVSVTAGFSIFLLLYFVLPRPMWIYVFGHELTHALAVWLAGGKVLDFRVGEQGGYVKTNTVNWWITLSPYFIPLYSLLWLGLWLSVDFYYPLDGYQEILFAGVGFTYAFHVCFTISMLHLHQSDIQSQGYLFSGVVILFFNLALLQFFLVLMAAPLTAADWWGSQIHRVGQAYSAPVKLGLDLIPKK
jgi:hypothetical protein